MIWNLVAIPTNQFPPQNKVVQHSLKQAELTSNKPHNETEPKDLCKTIHPSFFSLCHCTPLEAKMPLCSTTVTAVTMEESDGLFTSGSAGNGETRQKRKICINEWADLKHKVLRESENTHISKTG